MIEGKIIENMLMKYPELRQCRDHIMNAFLIIAETYRNGGKLLICGNGGSAADADHIVGELMKGFKLKRPVPSEYRGKLEALFPGEGDRISDGLQGSLPAISLGAHQAFICAYSNDVNSDMIFAQQVYGYAKPKDVLLGISTSGNSVNVLQAMKVAKSLGVSTIALTGNAGGLLKKIADITIAVPWTDTPDVQERHLPVYHALCLMLEDEFFG